MVKKAKGKTRTVPELSEEVAQRVASKKQEGDNAVGSKKYNDALAAYQAAIKELPEQHPEVAALHCNKAAIYLMEKKCGPQNVHKPSCFYKYKDAVRECNCALSIEGNNTKALLRRSKARQEMGMFKDSLSDMQKVNASADKTPDTEAAEAHLKDLVAAAQQQAAQQGSVKERAKQQLQRAILPCKVVLEDEIKLVHLRYGMSYFELRQLMREKWPGTLHFKIYWQDKDMDWVLITCGRDVTKSMQDVFVYTQRLITGEQRADEDAQVPKYKLIKCKKADVPPVPKEETPREDQTTKVIIKSTDPLAEETVVELDDWLIDFANIFREHLGVDPDKHVDVHREGWEKCTKALDSAIKLPEGRRLFGESIDRFRDVTCIGLYNWGNVHMCLAKKIVENAAASGQGREAVQAEFDAECAKATQRYQEALQYNPQYVDGFLGIAQVLIEKAKLAAGLLIAPLEAVDQEELKDADQETLEEVNKETAADANVKLKAALTKVNKDEVLKAASLWDEVYATFGKAAAAVPPEKREITKEREAAHADDVVAPEHTDQTHLLSNQVQIMWGNALYDQSQLWGGLDLPGWKEMVEDAKRRFTDATCPAKDVMQALRNHLRAADLDLPPEEVPSPAESSTPIVKTPLEPEKEAVKVKGLPALDKPKKKATKK